MKTTIVINGVTLTEAQTTTVQAALVSFNMQLRYGSLGLGKNKLYLACIREIKQLLLETSPASEQKQPEDTKKPYITVTKHKGSDHADAWDWVLRQWHSLGYWYGVRIGDSGPYPYAEAVAYGHALADALGMTFVRGAAFHSGTKGTAPGNTEDSQICEDKVDKAPYVTVRPSHNNLWDYVLIKWHPADQHTPVGYWYQETIHRGGPYTRELALRRGKRWADAHKVACKKTIY